jgi:hypothetical protein
MATKPRVTKKNPDKALEDLADGASQEPNTVTGDDSEVLTLEHMTDPDDVTRPEHPEHNGYLAWRPTSFTWALVAIVAATCAIAGYIVYQNRTNPELVPSTAIFHPKKTNKASVFHMTPAVSGIGQISWLVQPETLAGIDMYSPDSNDATAINSAEYYKLGTTKTGDTVFLSSIGGSGPSFTFGGKTPVVGVKKTDGNIILIANNSPAAFQRQADGSYYDTTTTYKKSVKIDVTTTIASLIPQNTVSYKGAALSRPATGSFLGFSITVPEHFSQIATMSDGAVMYQFDEPYQAKSFNLRGYAVRMADYQWYGYMAQLPGGANPETVASYNKTWITPAPGNLAASSYEPGRFGCGGIGTVSTMVAVDVEHIQAAGEVPGQYKNYPYYALTSDNPLTKSFYADYTQMLDYVKKGQYTLEPGVRGDLTLQQFAALPAVIGVGDTAGNMVVFAAKGHHITGGCAKPVVYLYPEKTIPVHVQIGATIWQSAPSYGPDGWHVLASPGGTLVSPQGIVHSLFWDGLGQGAYPAITTGTVVPAGQAVTTIMKQLAQQGLNATESSDFIDYWSMHLPTNKPYIRLSWLSKAQLDRLAPLAIAPAPDTVIRVFLDFEGLDAPVAMPAPALNAPARRGFTAVEWGGYQANLSPSSK